MWRSNVSRDLKRFLRTLYAHDKAFLGAMQAARPVRAYDETMLDLRSAAFLRPLPDFLTAPTDQNAAKLSRYVLDDLKGQPLAQRQLLALARRMYPIGSRGYVEISELYASYRVADSQAAQEHYPNNYTVVPLGSDSPAAHRDWYFSDTARRFFATWYQPYHFEELSFQVRDARGRPVLSVPCTIFRDNPITYFNQPIILLADRSSLEIPDQSTYDTAVEVAIRKLESLASDYLAHSFLVSADNAAIEEAVYSRVAARLHFINVRSQPMASLDRSDADIFGSLRRSYKSLVRAGQRTYSMSYYSGAGLTGEVPWIKNGAFALGADNYALPPHELEYCLDQCSQERGEVQIARDAQGEIAGIHIVLDDGLTTLYAIGAYKKSSTPVSHAMVFNSLIRARNRGKASFFLSHIPEPRFDFNGLELADAGAEREGYKFFKLGFANAIHRWTSFRVMTNEKNQSRAIAPDTTGIIYDTGRARVFEIQDSEGEKQRVLALGPAFTPWQGGFRISNPKFHIFQFSRHLTYGALCTQDDIANVLFLGYGAGITIQAVRDLFPNAVLDVVDLDGELFELSRKFFFDVEAPNVTLNVADANDFVRDSTKRYEYICCDLFGDDLRLPEFLTTDAFYVSVKRLLSERGVFSINAQGTEHKMLCELLVRHFRFVVSCQGRNATLIASDFKLVPRVDPDVKQALLANNVDVDAIQSTVVNICAAGQCDDGIESLNKAEHELLEGILASRSWKLTAPFRRLARLGRSVFARFGGGPRDGSASRI